MPSLLRNILILLLFASPVLAKMEAQRAKLVIMHDSARELPAPDADAATVPPPAQPLPAVPGAGDDAKAVQTPLLMKYMRWVYLHAPDTAFDFDQLKSFIETNPDWPQTDILVRRAELAIVMSHVGRDEAKNWFARHPPVTELGKLYAVNLSSGEGIPPAVIRQAWIEGNFSTERAERFLNEYGQVIRTEDDMARASRLVWDSRYKDVKAMENRLPEGFRLLLKARMDLRSNSRKAPYSVAQVPSHFAGDPGLLFDRISWRNAKGDRDGIRELMLIAPENVPNPEKWWPLRERAVREAIEDRQYSLARRLLGKHSLSEGARYQDALWLSGWLYLEFQKHPTEAYQEFRELYNASQYPHSKSRAAYWAGRAAEKNGNKDIATTLYGVAAEYPTTYYGQLAWYELNQHSPLKLPSSITPPVEDRKRFEQNELARVALMLGKLGQADMAKPFVLALADQADSASKAALAAELGEKLQRPDYMIAASKRSFQNGFLVIDRAYPLYRVPSGGDIEEALILGLSRQESQFYAGAVSPSGAVGVMQLMPGTAKEVAHKASIPFDRAQLYDPEYNMRLGTLYLSRLIERSSGSYIMAVAGYNAGPGRVDEWVRRFGSPGGNYREAINWIEKIPYSETRAYVQRVLENTQVYRQLLKPGSGFELISDLER